MKKVLSILLCVALACTMLMTGAWADGSAYTAGTYSASAYGKNGDVTLTVTFSDNAIEDIQVEHSETPTFGGAAIDTMKAQILDEQTLLPDAVSGATMTSKAFLTALADVAEQAGAEVKVADAAAEPVSYDVTEADVVVVGAGGAGLMAAYTAAKEGASVILLEKSGVVGGNSISAEMGINAAGSKVQEELGMKYATTELLAEAEASFGGRENLAQAYADASGETIDFLHDDLGIDFDIWHYPDGHTEEVNEEDPLSSVLEGHPTGMAVFMVCANADGYTTLTVVNALSKALETSGVVLYTNTEATELVTDDTGAVCGVKAVGADGNEVTFSSKAVLLTTGGFGQNQEMVAEANPDYANATTDESAPTTGDGITMATALGAKTVDMEYMQTHAHVIVGAGNAGSAPGDFKNFTGIIVNQDAQRYVTEARDTTDATLQQEKSFCIFNEEDLSDKNASLVAAGIIKSADTVEELAEELGLDPDALAATVEQWNADCAAGKDSQFDNEVLKPLEGKLYGYQFGVGIHYCMGGILINENTQVLNEDEEPIPGLYAAGEVTGGFHGNTRIDGSGTGDAFVFGHLAAEKIVEEVLG